MQLSLRAIGAEEQKVFVRGRRQPRSHWALDVVGAGREAARLTKRILRVPRLAQGLYRVRHSRVLQRKE